MKTINQIIQERVEATIATWDIESLQLSNENLQYQLELMVAQILQDLSLAAQSK